MHFLITAGGTREYIDPVRFISNASSGRMGYALAQAAIKAGYEVTLVSASDLQPPVGVDFVGVDSAAEMFAAVKKFFPKCDCLIMAAAVSDYTPIKKSKIKIKKSKRDLVIRLKPTIDILRWAGVHKNSKFEIRNSKFRRQRIVVGFALEDKNLRANAEKKLKEKNLDMIIVNTPSAIGKEKSAVQIKTKGAAWKKLPEVRKAITARNVIRLVEKVFKQKNLFCHQST